MSIDRFTKKQFEQALTDSLLGTTYKWGEVGLVMNEFRYSVRISKHVFMFINSSVKRDGYAAEAAENSIRVWLTDKDGGPLGNKIQRWVTREPGWQKRMQATIAKTILMGNSVQWCEKCASVEKVFIVQKEGPNHGRIFTKCNCPRSFTWLDIDDDQDDDPKPATLQTKVVDSIVGPKTIIVPPTCPKCGGQMKLRNRKSDNAQFWGCGIYPACNGTRPYAEPASSAAVNAEWVEQKNKFAEREAEQERQAFASDPDFQNAQKAEKLAALQSKLAVSTPVVEKPVEPSWNTFQVEFYRTVPTLQDGENIVEEALAGTGKTTCIAHSTKLLPRNKKVVVLVFNKHNVQPVREKIGKADNVQVCTYHSLGYRACMQAWPGIKKDDDKFERHLWSALDKEIYRYLYSPVKQLVSLVKANLAGVENTDLLDMCEFYGIELGEDADLIFETVRTVLARCAADTKHMDFDDMCWLPVFHGVPMEKYDYVYVDEAQDTNKVQMALALGSVSDTGHIIAVGDRFQSMYGFRGADAQAIPNLIAALNAKVLSLPVTYRNPQCIVDLVNQKFPEIPLIGTGKLGSISTITAAQALEMYKPGDMVLSRTNAPLVEQVFKLIQRGIKATIRGRDIGSGLIGLVRKMKASTIVEMLERLAEYKEREVEKLIAADKNSQASSLADKVETIIALCDGISTIFDLENRITNIFDDAVEGVVFSTIHRAKGLEAENVYLLRPELLPHPSAKKEWEKVQERNIEYVCYTRTLTNFYYVLGG